MEDSAPAVGLGETPQQRMGRRLQRARQHLNLSQEALAEQVGSNVRTIRRWEQGESLPQPHYREQLCQIFQTTAHALFDLGSEQEASPPGRSTLWHVPYLRNPCFTGREEILCSLHEALAPHKTVALSQRRTQAISGLGGIGKTQTAVEYAYRYAQEYQTILWAKAESRETLHSSFVTFAQLLQLPVQYEHDPQQIVEAVKRWLIGQKEWLLVLDNVEDLDLLTKMLPTPSQGHVILTTCLHATGKLAQRIDLESLNPDEGALLLLRRAQLLAPDAELKFASAKQRTHAKAVSVLLGGLPLALDQAGAYIEETQCGLQAYHDLFTRYPLHLLDWRGASNPTYPHSVSTTVALSFKRVEQAHPAAAELLRLCAFLHPDAIPEALIVQGAEYLGPMLGPVAANPLELNELFAVLGRFSLVQRHPETQAVSLHRLLQVVLRDRMEATEQRRWAERAIQVVNRVLPEAEISDHWVRLQVYVPHARTCSDAMHDLHLVSLEAGRLLAVMGLFLREGGQFNEAEAFQKHSQQCLTQAVDAAHPTIAFSLDELATVYTYQAKYEQAEPLYQQALAMLRQHLEPTHQQIVRVLDNLGNLAYAKSQYTQAEAYHQQALDLQEQAGRGEEVLTATLYGDQAMNYNAQGKYAQAERLYQRAFHLYAQHLEPEHPLVTSHLFNLACCYYAQGKYRLAETLFLQSLQLRQQRLGETHPLVADNLNSLGVLYEKLGNYAQGETYHRQALAIREAVYGAQHPWVAMSEANLARILLEQNQFTEAERLLEWALAIYKQALGMKHVRTIQCLTLLGRVYTLQEQPARAEPLLREALSLQEEVCGLDHPATASILLSLARLLSMQSRFEEAEPLYHQTIHLQEQTLGQAHPDLAESRCSLACFFLRLGKLLEAQSHYQHALRIWEQTLGLAHPQVRRYIEGYAQGVSEHERARMGSRPFALE